jgi:mannose/fructose/N-acetylgalactosamine-specific phosphotransferase system component IIB
VSFWVLLQILVNMILLAGVAFVWVKLQRPPKDDPRLSRGLQILQSKISVLEDLSDNTEKQVQQAIHLIDRKINDLQEKILESSRQIELIESSRTRSMEVAKIFQDKIPHQEIIERQNTIKYVKAARLAHQGLNVDEIAKQVDLSRGELEFIAKVNRNQLQFSEADLPDWAHDPSDFSKEAAATEAQPLHRASAQLAPTKDATMSALGQKFRQVVGAAGFDSTQPIQTNHEKPTVTFNANTSTTNLAAQPQQSYSSSQRRTVSPPPAEDFEYASNARGETVKVKKMVFPRVNLNNNLS